ncbi:hypothetical protein F442_05199, partial [Phytophthora nicotianae P10297]
HYQYEADMGRYFEDEEEMHCVAPRYSRITHGLILDK